MAAEAGVSVSILRGAIGFVRERVGNFMANSVEGGKGGRLKEGGDFWSSVSLWREGCCSFGGKYQRANALVA